MAKGISKNHIEFIRLVSKGDTLKNAYSLSYPNKNLTKGTIAVESSKLASKYAKEIEQEREKLKNLIQSAHDSETVKNALESILTQAEVDGKLCEIIKGESKIETEINTDGIKVTKTEKPTHMEILKAIDLYNKRFGSNAPTKTELTGKDGEAFNFAPQITILPKSES